MVASRTAPRPMSFIGTLSQTLTLRAAFASSTYLLSQIPGPGRSSDDDLLIPLIPFSRGRIRPSCAPERMATASLLFGRHLMMPCCSFWTMAGQRYCPRRIARLPRIIRLTQSSSTSHGSKGCARMSLTAATRLQLWGLAYLNPPPLTPFLKGRSGPSGFPSPHGFPCPPTSARHLIMPCLALEGGACEAGGPGPHGGFLLPGHDHFSQT